MSETNIIQVPIKQGGTIEANYRRTVVNGVSKDSLEHVCHIPVDHESVRVWGNQNDESADTGDYLLFSKRDGRSDGEYTLLARIAHATVLDKKPAEEFTKQVGWDQDTDRIFPHIMFLEPVYRVNLDRERFWDIMDFKGWPNDTYSPIWFGREGSRFFNVYNSKQEFVEEIVGEQLYPTEKDEIQTQYWNLVKAKREAGSQFLDQPSEKNLAAFLEEFWTLRAAPSVDWILSNWLSEYSPEEVADKLREAIEQEDISIAVELNGFGVPVASECLRALEPSTFPILNGPAYEGMKTLGYDPVEPSDSSPKDYLDFAADVADAVDQYELLEIAEDADSIVFPEWATVLQIVDHLFYQHTNEDHEFTFDEWLPCESSVETAPYYWVNQPSPSEEKVQLEAASGNVDSEIGRLEINDTVFHHAEGEIVGYSTVDRDPETVKVDDELRCRVNASFTGFEESIPFSNVFDYLLHEKDEDDEYFPVDESGLKSGYLYNLSEPAGNYILQQIEPDEPPASQVDRLQKRLSQPEFSISLPTNLYFHEREESRLKQQINAALNSGKHIIFTGPPGTGKSKLAKAISEQAADRHDQIDGHVFTTATAEWTTFDTIGGYVPDESGDSLEFDPRLFLRCFRDDDDDVQNKWLVVDELNRANIDKALGPLFSVLAEDSVQLPFEREHRIQIDWIENYSEDEEGKLSEIAHDPDRFPVTPSWWLIGTMNTVDKTSLYDLSFAFMRRFSFIHVGVPELIIENDGEDIVSRKLLDPEADGQNYASTWQQDQANLRDTIDNYHEELSIIWTIVNRYRPIGPAIVLDLIQHLDAHEGGDENTPLTSAIISLVLPQMEGLREQHQLDLLNDIEKGLPIQDEEDETAGREVELRIDFDYLRRKAYDMFDLDPDK